MGAVSLQHLLCCRKFLVHGLVELAEDHHGVDGPRTLLLGRERGADRADGGALDPDRRHVGAGQPRQWRADAQARRQRRGILRRHQHTLGVPSDIVLIRAGQECHRVFVHLHRGPAECPNDDHFALLYPVGNGSPPLGSKSSKLARVDRNLCFVV